MYFHKKIHNLDWTCDECDIKFNRKWNLQRHLMESHSLHLHEVDNDAESQENDDSSSDGLNKESDFDLESED